MWTVFGDGIIVVRSEDGVESRCATAEQARAVIAAGGGGHVDDPHGLLGLVEATPAPVEEKPKRTSARKPAEAEEPAES